MNQRGGMATIALLIAAVLGVSYLPRKAAESSGGHGAQTTASRVPAGGASSNKPTAARAIPSCEQIAKRLRRFYRPDEQPPQPVSCYPAGGLVQSAVGAPTHPNLSFAIAIVPNPIQTHLPLMFDRQIDAIQQAVQDTGFIYDSAWFPWNPSDLSDGQQSEEQQSANLQSELHGQPGIMVFRHGADPNGGDPYQNGVVVFVVAEQPTGGIDDVQFAHAIAWVAVLGSCELRIIGPTFSGTLGSLAHGLSTTGAVRGFPDGVRIFSGAANSNDNVASFQQFLAQPALRGTDSPKPPPPQFRTFLESDRLMTDRFLCYMQHEGYDLSYFAILSEDETAFGEAPTSSNAPRCSDHAPPIGSAVPRYEGKPLYLYYPRDIAKLRSAYEQQSVFSAGKQQAGAPSASLKEDLSEPISAEHDTVRSYGGKLTPQSQEAVLFGLGNVLSSRNIEFVIIRSTNTLDQLFLSEFLRRAYPNGRIVLDGADLLFRRGMEGASLRGVMMLSTYPLLTWTHDAVPTIEGPPGAGYRVFQQDLSEGTYIAARELLKSVPGAASSVSIADYAPPHFEGSHDPPASNKERPPTWLTVVGHRQFWPLAYLNDQTETEGGKNYSPSQKETLLQAEPNRDGNRWGTTGLPLEMWGLLIAGFFLALWHCYCCSKGSIHRPPKLLAYFAPVPRLQHAVLIFIGSLLLAFLAINQWVLVVVPGWGVLTAPTLFAVTILALAIFVFAYSGCMRNYRLHVISGVDDPERRERLQRIDLWRGRLRALLVPAAVFLGLLWFFFLPHHLGPANRVPLFWRTVFLRSGVSGILPQVLLLLGIYSWYWLNLHGMALFGDDRPRLPKVDDLPQFREMVPATGPISARGSRHLKIFSVFSREGAGNNIEMEARPMGKRYRASLKYFLPISYLALWIAVGGPILSWHSGSPLLPGLRTLGDIRFGTVIFFGVALCSGLILADTFQLQNTWSQLRQLLIFLDRLRLRRTLATLRGLYGGSIWKLSGNLLEGRYRLISRQLESLRALDSALEGWKTGTEFEERHREIARLKVQQCEQSGHDFVAWYVDLLDDGITLKDRPDKEYNVTPLTKFQHMLAETAGCVMTQIILPEWQQDSNTMIRVSDAKDLEAAFDQQVANLPPHVSAAEEFFLLPYMGFIQNILGRIRTIALSIVAVFVAMTLAVSSYPFDPLPVIGAVFLVLFTLVGVSLLFAYAEMSRDATLSRISDTNPGELGWGFWVKMIALGAGPLLGLLTTLFPSMTDFVVSFLQPGAQAFK